MAATMLLVASCHDPNDPTHEELSGLVAKQASRQEVITKFGAGSTWYGRQGDQNFQHLVEFLRREPASWGAPLRQAMAQERGILFYTSAWQMTWLFFDSADRLTGYWITAQ